MQTAIIEHNPAATMPLVIPATLTCNTPEEKILANMEHNARAKPHGWVKREPEHGGVALICGGGPSIEDYLEQIAAAKAAGGTIFALNGCSSFLRRHGIKADYQVILDAQPATAELVDLDAKAHLFASQVDPQLFELVPDAILWHATHGEIAPEYPWYEHDYTMIGGAVTVGNASLVLAYALGFRKIECYGFDSSHRKRQSHAYRQPMNDGDPLTELEFNGTKYLCSLTMRAQVKHFMERVRSLLEAGCRIWVHGDGLLPAVFHAPQMSEVDKYRNMWRQDGYRITSPGELIAPKFVEWARPRHGQVVADLGCGTGRGGKAIKRLTGCSVLYVDFAENCLDEDLELLKVSDLADIKEPLADYAYCTDVMEHIPPERLDATMAGILASAPKVFLQISTVPDDCGEMIGQTLHMNVCSSAIWLNYMLTLQTHRVVAYEDHGDACLFFLVKESQQ